MPISLPTAHNFTAIPNRTVLRVLPCNGNGVPCLFFFSCKTPIENYLFILTAQGTGLGIWLNHGYSLSHPFNGKHFSLAIRFKCNKSQDTIKVWKLRSIFNAFTLDSKLKLRKSCDDRKSFRQIRVASSTIHKHKSLIAEKFDCVRNQHTHTHEREPEPCVLQQA